MNATPDTLYAVAALSMGLVGSLHCLGMCGPIVLALPRQGRGAHAAAMLVAHHLGRSLTYAVMGLAAGALGHGLSLAGFQKGLSIGMGLVLLLALAGQTIRWRVPLPSAYVKFVASIKSGMSRRFHSGGVGTRLVFGALNGLLPCGLVYTALAAALATGGALSGALFMFLFGLASSPALVALSVGGWHAGDAIRPLLRRAAPALTFVFGVLFVVRGLGLGIPYLSPGDASRGEAAAAGAVGEEDEGFSCCSGKH